MILLQICRLICFFSCVIADPFHNWLALIFKLQKIIHLDKMRRALINVALKHQRDGIAQMNIPEKDRNWFGPSRLNKVHCFTDAGTTWKRNTETDFVVLLQYNPVRNQIPCISVCSWTYYVHIPLKYRARFLPLLLKADSSYINLYRICKL